MDVIEFIKQDLKNHNYTLEAFELVNELYSVSSLFLLNNNSIIYIYEVVPGHLSEAIGVIESFDNVLTFDSVVNYKYETIYMFTHDLTITNITSLKGIKAHIF